MVGKIFGVFVWIAVLFACITKRLGEVGAAVLDGAQSAVEVSLSLCGMMIFWGGMMEVMKEAGVLKKLSKWMLPILKRLFPSAAASQEGIEEISANLSANLLGVGNAATPFAVCAMEKMQKHNPHPEKASAEQMTLAVLNTSSLTVLPSTLLALRRAAGAKNPFAILLPVWVCSFSCFLLSALLCLALGTRKGEKSGG